MDDRRSKRKRKTFGSYLKWERYQGKRKRFGRGTVIGEDTFNYFVRIMEVKISDFSTDEDKEIFIDNVFEQTAGREIDISCNQLGSMAIEKFLPLANDKILLRFTYTLSKDLRMICCDEFGSHVLQQLIIVVSARLQKIQSSNTEQEANQQNIQSNNSKQEAIREKIQSSNTEQEARQESQSSTPDMSVRFKNWLQQVCKFVVNNIQEFVWAGYANYVTRTVLECLSGLPPGSTSKGKKREKVQWAPGPESTISPIDEGFLLVQECGQRILKMPQVFDNVYTSSISGLLQTILATVRKVNHKLSGKIVHHLLDYCFDPELQDFQSVDSIPGILMCQAGTHLMDVMISVAKKKTFTQIYARCFNNKLQSLSLASDANFCVQSLIKHCKEKTEFESIFEELSPNFEALLHSNKHGVLLALGQSCQRLKCKQGEFMKQLQAAFHCVEPERQVLFPLLVAHLVDYEAWCRISRNENDSEKPFATVTGSLLLQTMLHFMEPIKIIRGLLDMDNKHLVNLLCDRCGSRIGDAFFDSQTVGGKKKMKFFQKLQGSFVSLAVSKYGIWVLEKIWLWAPLNVKKLILEELAPCEAMVNSVAWGSIFAVKNGLSLFKRRPNDWEESQTRKTRAEKLFADIIGS